MAEQFIPLAEQSPDEIARKLREIGDDEAAQFYEARSEKAISQEEGLHRPRAWLYKSYQHGFIPLFTPGSGHRHDIISATDMPADQSLINQRINVRLDRFHVHEYPMALTQGVSSFFLGTNVHTIMFKFEASNQVAEGTESVAFNQVYEAVAGQDTGDTGYPIFIGLKVGSNGVGFKCDTVNVGSSNDQKLVNAINSNTVQAGLHLLTTAQPGLVPFVGIAKGLATSFANRSKNVAAQHFSLGLDFETGATGARIAIGTYISVQVPDSKPITWQDWCYDAQKDTIVRKNLAEGEEAHTLPYNTIMFRVSRYREEPAP